MTFVFPAIVLWFYMSLLFVISIVRRDNGTADIGYGVGVMVVVIGALSQNTVSGAVALLCALPFIWGTRLAVRIFRKNYGKPEDFRYKAWRDSWGKWFVVRSYFQIYMLQGLVIFLVAFPILLTIVAPKTPVVWLAGVGIVLWLLGFFFEAVGDYQLDRFLKDPANKGNIMGSGLWRYSRHPNYFGESMMWWGIAIAASGLSAYPLLGFVSPFLITYLLLFVSGVPMLEKRWAGNPDWEAYKARTSVFVPLPPRQ